MLPACHKTSVNFALRFQLAPSDDFDRSERVKSLKCGLIIWERRSKFCHSASSLEKAFEKTMDRESPVEDQTGTPFLPKSTNIDGTVPQVSLVGVAVGRENLGRALPPHESYEGRSRWDPNLIFSDEEERRVVRKTDIRLLSWLCLMVCARRAHAVAVFANGTAVPWIAA